ncbi:MAG: aldehyde dehydrogenase family protein [Planktomarina sp.]|uniref:aldehyde dehydrogenase family protein n=1 Tax=Planktomarina sp. TaxID=2024851 RepID=UPI003261175F|nr:aldehyde dehydrogenase family protein [Planktomarina sp.]
MSIETIFDTMDYGTAPEDRSVALQWIADRGGLFGAYVNGAFAPARDDLTICNPATGEKLAGVTLCSKDEVAEAVRCARAAQADWQAAGGPARARVLYALARLMQKYARLLAVMESLDNGKPIRESRDIDIPLAIRHFYHHAGHAQLMPTALADRVALGVCGQIIPWNFPLLMLAWKIAPALAMGNTVVLKPAEYTPMTAMIFADLCTQAGVPPGVVNIVTGDGSTGAALVDANVDKIAFTGSTSVGRQIQEATAGSGKSLTLELGGKSPYIVFDDADIDSAIEGLVDAIWFNQGQVCCAGSRLLIHEAIADDFHARLKVRMDKLRIGDPLDKSIDVGAIVDPIQLHQIRALVQANTAGQTYHAQTPVPEGCFYPPTLITGLHPADTLMQEEIFGPVLVSTTFRTPAEAVEIANNSKYGLAATLWTENINLALEIAPKLVGGVVWVNATNLFDAAAGFGGTRESGFGREGGWEGLRAYSKPAKALPEPTRIAPFTGQGASADEIDRTAKLFIGGKQARPDGGYSQAIFGPNGQLLGHAPIANRKDIRNAVQAQLACGWGKTTGHLRAQILYYIAENLAAQTDRFAERLDAMTGLNAGAEEVRAAVDILFTYAAWADKFEGRAKSVPMRAVALAMREPVGAIAALCSDHHPLLGLVTPMAAALSTGNSITLCASAPFPLAATDFSHILEASDVPAGAVNILTGPQADLAPHLGAHMGLEAVWCLSGAQLTQAVQARASSNIKRVWQGAAQDDHDSWLDEGTEIKTIWIPYGE